MTLTKAIIIFSWGWRLSNSCEGPGSADPVPQALPYDDPYPQCYASCGLPSYALLYVIYPTRKSFVQLIHSKTFLHSISSKREWSSP